MAVRTTDRIPAVKVWTLGAVLLIAAVGVGVPDAFGAEQSTAAVASAASAKTDQAAAATAAARPALASGPSAPAPAIAWRVAMVGDVMLGSDYPAADLPPNEGRDLLAAAQPILQAVDVAIGNLEGAIAQGGQTTKTGCVRCFAFRMPPTVAPVLRAAGFRLWSSANNHASDFGDAGRAQTTQAVQKAGMLNTGGLTQPEARWTVRGRQLCLMAFAPNMGMNDLRDIPAAQDKIRKTRARCDLLIVTFHGGGEGVDHSHTPVGTEWFLGENRGDVRAFAHAALDAGADLVFGSGPHIARGMELYHHKLIAYSLGNFMTYGGISVAGPLGWSALLEVNLDDQGRLVSGQIHAFRQTPRQPLAVDPDLSVVKLMVQRTQEDFAGGGLSFDAQGKFSPADTAASSGQR